jgi:hypothetical protein
MKRLLPLLFIGMLGLTGCDELKSRLDHPVGRFQIVFSPHLRKDTYLLDTETGRVWVSYGDKNGDTAGFQQIAVTSQQ